jgi:hypothetical protein
MPQRDQKQLRAFPSSELHRRDEIAIGSHQYNDLYLSLQGETGDVETDAHVDTLLPDVRLEIIGADFDSRPLLPEHASFETPSFLKQLTESQRKEWLAGKRRLHSLVSRGEGAPPEVDQSAAS